MELIINFDKADIPKLFNPLKQSLFRAEFESQSSTKENCIKTSLLNGSNPDNRNNK